MQVPFLDIRAQNESIWPELQAAIDPVMSQAQFVLGPATAAFEEDFARFIGAGKCVGVNNGTSALHMALVACDVGPGDEVITTPHTWISTSWAISYVGAKPVFVDIDPKTYNIDARQIEAAITPQTKAILPVHLYGQMADMATIKSIADKHGLLLIEDAAQAHGASSELGRAGSIGRVGCFSFYPGKNLGAFGEGGAVVSNDPQIAERVRRLRDHAQVGRHHHVEIGFNTRMEGLQAAVLAAKLPHLDAWNERRRSHAEEYCRRLSDVTGITLPAAAVREAHVWHLFVVLVSGVEREAFRSQLAELGVATGVHYPTPVPLQPAYSKLGHQLGDFPVAEDVMSRCVSLPMFPELRDEQIEYVAQSIHHCLEKADAVK